MKKIHLLLPLILLLMASKSNAQSEVERTLSDFKGIVLSQGVEAELIKGTSNKVVLTFSGAKEKQVISEITEGKLVIGYKGDKKPDGASIKAKIYASGALSSIELATSSSIDVSGVAWAKKLLVKVTGASTAKLNPSAANLDVRVNGKSTLNMKAKAESAVLSVSTSGKAKVEMECTSLETKVASKGRLDILGSTETLKVVSNNSAKYMGYDMKSKSITVQAHSSGWAEVYASESIVVNVVSDGKVFYKGNPGSTKFNGTSSGKIEQAD